MESEQTEMRNMDLQVPIYKGYKNKQKYHNRFLNHKSVPNVYILRNILRLQKPDIPETTSHSHGQQIEKRLKQLEKPPLTHYYESFPRSWFSH